MYGVADPSTGPKLLMTAGHAAVVAAVAWLLLGDGIARVAVWSGAEWLPGDPLRRLMLFGCALIYFARLIATCFAFLKRRLDWRESIQVVVWLAMVHAVLAFAGGTNGHSMGIIDALGIAFYGAGAALNTGAEWFRLRWRARPENRHRLCVDGPYRYSMHPNYLGDVILFSGWAILSGRWWTATVPALMLLLFVTINMPILDRHLARRYGAAFEDWARGTWRLVPFIY